MTDLTTLQDHEIVSEMQVRLARGTVGFDGLYSQHHIDYRASYRQVCLLSTRWNIESIRTFDERHIRELRNLLNELGSSQAVRPGVYAVNITFYEKQTALQNHQPVQEAAA